MDVVVGMRNKGLRPSGKGRKIGTVIVKQHAFLWEIISESACRLLVLLLSLPLPTGTCTIKIFCTVTLILANLKNQNCKKQYFGF